MYWLLSGCMLNPADYTLHVFRFVSHVMFAVIVVLLCKCCSVSQRASFYLWWDVLKAKRLKFTDRRQQDALKRDLKDWKENCTLKTWTHLHAAFTDTMIWHLKKVHVFPLRWNSINGFPTVSHTSSRHLISSVCHVTSGLPSSVGPSALCYGNEVLFFNGPRGRRLHFINVTDSWTAARVNDVTSWHHTTQVLIIDTTESDWTELVRKVQRKVEEEMTGISVLEPPWDDRLVRLSVSLWGHPGD